MKGVDVAERARALVGTRFRPQGRNRRDGLDCVGTAALAAGIAAERIPADYALRGQFLDRIESQLRGFGWTPVPGHSVRAGDLLVCEAGPAQFHMVIATHGAFVHADASLRRVVERPLPVPWPVAGAWRSAEEDF